MPELQPHQQRVVDEKADLDTKATALSKFIGESPIFATLQREEQIRLREQCEVMWQYSSILGSRIQAFAQLTSIDLDSDTPLAPACDLTGDGTCEACQ